MQALVEHLDLLAKRDIGGLRKVCGVDDEDIADMIGEIRRLNPKPAWKFGSARLQTMVPDVYVRPGSGWRLACRAQQRHLARVLVNQTYYSQLSKKVGKDGDKSYFHRRAPERDVAGARARPARPYHPESCHGNRARQQDGSSPMAWRHLRPLNLKAVATPSRCMNPRCRASPPTKYMATNRGTFELKYFFTASIASADGGEAHSAESRASPHQAADRFGSACRDPVG